MVLVCGAHMPHPRAAIQFEVMNDTGPEGVEKAKTAAAACLHKLAQERTAISGYD